MNQGFYGDATVTLANLISSDSKLVLRQNQESESGYTSEKTPLEGRRVHGTFTMAP